MPETRFLPGQCLEDKCMTEGNLMVIEIMLPSNRPSLVTRVRRLVGDVDTCIC